MLSRRIDLWIVLALVALTGAGLGLWPTAAVPRAILGVVLVLALPGYALEAALFEPGSLAAPVRLALIMGLGLAVTAIGGLALYWTPWGLQTGTWYVWLGALTVGACLIAFWRFPRSRPVQLPALARLSWQPVALLGAALVISGAAVVVARQPAPPDNAHGYTQLWIVPAPQGAPRGVRLGVSSSEFEVTHYRLQITLDGQSLVTEPDIALAPGARWEGVINLPVITGPGTVEGTLYRLDDPSTVYRRVKLKLDPTKP